MNERLKRLQSWIHENELSFVFLSEPTNVFYITGFRCQPHERLLGLFIFANEEPILICPAMEVPQAKSSGWTNEIIGYHDHDNPWESIKTSLDKRNIKHKNKVAIETTFLPYEKVERLRQYVSDDILLVSVEKTLHQLRMIKDKRELQLLKQAAELADYAVGIGCEAIETGQTEMGIVANIEYELTKKGVSEMAFSTMVLAGDNSALPHGHPGNRAIKEGDFVLFDLGVVIDGYCSDITRTVAYKHLNNQQEDIYQTVLNAITKATELAKVNNRLGDLDIAARKVIEDAGYGEYFPHRLGHGLGLEAHESPSISQVNDMRIQEGMVFTLEPGVYMPKVGGVRIEDDIYINQNGPITLTKFPKDLQIIR